MSIAMPSSALICLSTPKTLRTTSGASPGLGSSQSSKVGRLIRARATASICCSPPDSVPAAWPVRAASAGMTSCFDDPLLAELHLADFTAPIGPDTYVEVLAPTRPDHSVARWLGRVGGSAGWVLSTQVPSLDGVRERAAEHGVRIAVETHALGHDIVQLHPRDVGVLLELDEFLPRVDEWFWDDMEAAKAAQAGRSTKGGGHRRRGRCRR